MEQDLRTYPKTDPNELLVVDGSGDKVTWTGMARNDPITKIAKSLGVGAIVENTVVTYLTNLISGSSSASLVGTNIYSNDDLSLFQLEDSATEKYVVIYFIRTISSQIILRYSLGSSAVFDILAGITLNVERLIDFSRSGDIYTAIIYNGTTVGSGVLDTLIIDCGETPPDFEWHSTANNFNDNANNGPQTGHARTFNFTGLVGVDVKKYPRSRVIEHGLGRQTRGGLYA